MKIFFDANISKAMAEGIAAFARSQEVVVEHLIPRFRPDTPDTEWIGAIQSEGWTIVSGDPRISRHPANLAAWRESRLTAFFLGDGWASKRFWVQAQELVRWCPIIIETAGECRPGSGFLLPFKGSLPRRVYEPEAD